MIIPKGVKNVFLMLVLIEISTAVSGKYAAITIYGNKLTVKEEGIVVS